MTTLIFTYDDVEVIQVFSSCPISAQHHAIAHAVEKKKSDYAVVNPPPEALLERVDLSYFEVVERYRYLIEPAALAVLRTVPKHVDPDDIRSAGLSGLMAAAKHYSSDKFSTFYAYAAITIRGRMLDALRKMDDQSRRTREFLRALKAATVSVESRLNREATDDDVATEMGITTQVLRKRRDVYQNHFVSLDAPLHNSDSGTSLIDLIHDESKPVHSRMEESEIHWVLKECIQLLPENEQKVLYTELGWETGEAQPRAAAARAMKVTESRVCQLRRKAIISLRRLIAKNL